MNLIKRAKQITSICEHPINYTLMHCVHRTSTLSALYSVSTVTAAMRNTSKSDFSQR